MDFLSPQDPILAYKEIISSLEKEENKGAWVLVCDSIYKNIPALAYAKGRMSNESLRTSLVGALNFTSFKDFIEAPRERNGLGWTMNTWNVYKRNYAYVKKYPYLRELALTPHEIEVKVKEFKKHNIEFPDSLESYESSLEALRASKSEAKADVASGLRSELQEAKKGIERYKTELFRQSQLKLNEIAEHRQKYDQVIQEKETLQNKINELTLRVSELTSELSQKDTEIAKLEAELREYTKRQIQEAQRKKAESKEDKQPPKISWFEHFKGIFGLSKF